jgi:hypothetical protein
VRPGIYFSAHFFIINKAMKQIAVLVHMVVLFFRNQERRVFRKIATHDRHTAVGEKGGGGVSDHTRIGIISISIFTYDVPC